VNGRRVKTIDVHAHCLVPEACALVGKKIENHEFPDLDEVGPKRIGEMDKQGIDMEALSINPFWYRTERDRAAEIVRIQNEKLAEMCAAYPERFVAFASVALQYPDLAVEQLVHGVKKLGYVARPSARVLRTTSFPIRSFTRSGRRRRSSACLFSSTRKARRS